MVKADHSEAIQSCSKMRRTMGHVSMKQFAVYLKVFCGTVVNSCFNSLAQGFWI